MLWSSAIDIVPAQLVIEAFAVNLPESYVEKMSLAVIPPVWINLEYLSAESWVGSHHLLPSPHSKYALTKHFFFPGFLPDTGGLIRERNLLEDCASDITLREAEQLRVFLFGYDNSASENLMRAFAKIAQPVRCTLPEGVLANRVSATKCARDPAGAEVEIMSFVEQRHFDHLLWRHDVLFVRGEDSFVRAQWASKPFVWQIYPQSDNAHWIKLNAFLALYCEGLAIEPATSVRELWRAWNAQDCDKIAAAWIGFYDHLPALRLHAKSWSAKLAQMPDLAANLLSFYEKNIKI
jgi:uncharacterized repeat protein (TIGR03837 family)